MVNDSNQLMDGRLFAHILPQLSTVVNDSNQLMDDRLFAHILTSAIHDGK